MLNRIANRLVPLSIALALVVGAVACSDSDAGGPHEGAMSGSGAGGGSGSAGTVSGDGGSSGAAGNSGGGSGGAAGTAVGGDEEVDVDAPWPVLSTNATPFCTHDAAAEGFRPLLVGAYDEAAGAENYSIVAVSSKGEAVKLNCADHPSPEPQFLPSPDRRKFWISVDGVYYVTSWLLAGVFALPNEFDGLRIRQAWRWISDDYLVAIFTRQDEGTNEVVDRALVAVRWDGTDTRRLHDAVIASNDDSSVEWLGQTKDFGVYRLDSAPDEGGFEYYRLSFADWSSTLLASDIGGNWVSVFGSFNEQTRQIVIAGDGAGIDYMFAIDIDTAMVRPLNAHVNGTQAFITPDGRYVVWGTPSEVFARALLPGDDTLITYEEITRERAIAFQRAGHAFTAFTASRGLFLANPETGAAGVVEHDAIADGAVGVSSTMIASDAEHVFFTMTTSADGPSGMYVASLGEPAALLSEPGRSASFDEFRQAADQVVFSDGQALYHADLEGNVTKIPGTDGAESGGSLGWSSADKSVLLHVHGAAIDGLLLWKVGEPAVTDLRNPVTDALGQLAPGWSHVLLR